MSIYTSAQNLHPQYCPARNKRIALILVGCFSILVFVGWTGLHKAFQRPSLIDLPFALFAVTFCTKGFVIFKCFRERLLLALVIANIVVGEAYGYLATIERPYAELIRTGELSLAALGLLVSLSMLFQPGPNPHSGLNGGEATVVNQIKQRSLILLAVILTVLFLGAMLYFLPLR